MSVYMCLTSWTEELNPAVSLSPRTWNPAGALRHTSCGSRGQEVTEPRAWEREAKEPTSSRRPSPQLREGEANGANEEGGRGVPGPRVRLSLTLPSRSVWVSASVYPLAKWGCKGSIGSGPRACLLEEEFPHPDNTGSSRSPKASQPFL